VRIARQAWWIAGLATGVAGLGTSYFAAELLSVRASPVLAVAELIIKLTPGAFAENAIQTLGHKDKPVLVTVVLIGLAVIFAWTGSLARRSWWASLGVLAVVTGIGAYAVSQQRNAGPADYAPVAVGVLTWLICLSILTDNLRAAERRDSQATVGQPTGTAAGRRGFLVGAGVVVVASVGAGLLGRVVGAGRRQVEAARGLLRLPGVTEPVAPAGTSVGLEGITPWVTDAAGFYQVHTAIVPPAIEPSSWKLRIHGLVDREVTITYEQLMARRLTEAWVTLNCVSNPVGGPLIGNAWWSGVRLADILEEAGVQAGADAVLQTSDDGWTCGTPLAALTDGRDAMLVVAMNGEPLPIAHGFPVRTLVPGLYGYVSACKWVVDMEVTRFDKISAYWTERGWAELGPVKLASRIDVPRRDDEITAGDTRVGGMAWCQDTGISAVEVSLDGGAWQSADLGNAETIDSWAQWSASLSVEPGEHTLRVRATDDNGQVQTSVVADVLPDGASGWHEVHFTAV
jgi:DMSO/TMAO reductase YedYZ molybdopterin-dependent catalytic subunit